MEYKEVNLKRHNKVYGKKYDVFFISLSVYTKEDLSKLEFTECWVCGVETKGLEYANRICLRHTSDKIACDKCALFFIQEGVRVSKFTIDKLRNIKIKQILEDERI